MTKAEIAGLIPHAGAMCLLDGVLEWDEQRVRCVAHSHRDAANPLRLDDGWTPLPAWNMPHRRWRCTAP